MLPYPSRRAAHRAPEELRDRRRGRPLPPADGPPGPAPDGLRRVRAAGREQRDQDRRAPARLDRRVDRGLPAPVPRAGASRSTGRASSPPTSRATTAGPSGSSCSSTSAAWPTASEAAVNWCPNDATVLANEQVIDGRCERCGTPVEARQLEQWFFRITDYADRLLDDLDDDRVARARQDHAAQLDRPLRGRRGQFSLRPRWASTTRSSPLGPTRCSARRSSSWRPSTPTCCAWPRAPSTRQAVRAYVNHALTESHEERGDAEREKTGVPLGRTVVNPVNGEQIPMYVADYVLMEYGTGAIMAVPGHDERDHAFAEQVRAADPARDRGRASELPYTGDGRAGQLRPALRRPRATARRSSRSSTGSTRRAAATASVNYRLRDWLLSRQRYWGCPIPIVYCDALRHRAGARGGAAGRAARHRGLRAEGPLAAGGGGGLGRTSTCPRVRRAGAARDRHDGHVRRLLLVLPALLRRRATTRRPGIPRCWRAGCRSTSTSAASSTRSCT